MTEKKYISKGVPNYFIIVILVCTILFSYKTTVSISNATWQLAGFADSTVRVIAIAFMLFFLMLAGASLYALTRFKTYLLTNTNLIIKQKMLFKEQIIPLTEIGAIKEDRPAAKTLDAISSTNAYTGSITTIVLQNNEELKISSLEVWNRKKLIKALRAQLNTIYGGEVESKS